MPLKKFAAIIAIFIIYFYLEATLKAAALSRMTPTNAAAPLSVCRLFIYFYVLFFFYYLSMPLAMIRPNVLLLKKTYSGYAVMTCDFLEATVTWIFWVLLLGVWRWDRRVVSDRVFQSS